MSLRGFFAFALAAAVMLPAASAFADRDKRDHRDNRDDDDDDNDDWDFREWRGRHPPVRVSGFAPRSGPPGTIVTITGQGFFNRTQVAIGGIRVKKDMTSFRSLSFPVPADIGDGTIVLRQPGGHNDVIVGRFNLTGGDRLVITGFSPDNGPPGTRVSIYGRFRGGDQFGMNGRGLQVVDLDPGRATVVIPQGARDDELTVQRPSTGARAVSAGRFQVTGAAPFISNMTPQSGPPGSPVRLEGGGFAPDDTVTYGRMPVQITARSGAHFDVVVPRDAQHNSYFVVRGPRGEVNSPQPFQLDLDTAVIGSFQPTAGGPGTRVVLRGGRFLPGDDVLLSGRQLPVQDLDSERIVVAIPEGVTTDVFSLRRRGRIIAASGAPFTVTYGAPPVVGNFTPGGGPPGTNVTLYGDNFTPDVRVSYDGQALPITARQGERAITVVVPNGARRSAPFIVANRAGETRTGAHFQLYTPAIVDSISPTSGPWFTQVYVKGRGFHGDEIFYIADRPVDRAEQRGDTWVVMIPNGAVSGVLSYDSGGQRFRTPFRFDVLSPPLLESFAPRSGPPGTQVVIRGRDLGTVAAVSYGGLPCSIVQRSPREIVIAIPAGAQGADYLNLEAAGGRARSAERFRVSMPGPAPASFSPSAAPVGAQVALVGAYFSPSAQVWYRDLPCPIVSIGPSRIVFTVPAGAYGRAPFIVTDESGARAQTAQAFEVLVPPPPPPPPLPPPNDGHHEHAHEHPHGDGGHHHHPHAHPHRTGDNHHHPY